MSPALFYLSCCLGALGVLAALLYIGFRREQRRDAIERLYETLGEE